MDLDLDKTSLSKGLKQNEEVDMGGKGKMKICYDETWQNQDKDTLASDLGKSSTSGSIISNNLNSSPSELSCPDNDNNEDDEDMCDEDMCNDDDYGSDYDYDYDYDYDDNDNYMEEDDYANMQSQFDNVDLPTGVEVSIPWLQNLAPSGHSASSTSTSTISDNSETKRKATIPELTESKRKATISNVAENKSKVASSSSSTVPEESSSNGQKENEESGVVPKREPFRQFDTVNDFSDHHYSSMGFLGEEQPPKSWAKKVQDEWKILEKNLPDTIFVRVSEARMELLRAVMIGPSGTPYHDGLFIFDCLFPRNYPNVPPMVYYYSGGLRLNPNLYECGKVCLSLLGTWSGKSTEMWSPKNSTMLQVLVSIQGLILNEKPYFNEPGYESHTGPRGEQMSKDYNEKTLILSLKTMMYTLRNPPKYFEELATDHFRSRAHDILVACKAYTEGAEVGHVMVENGVPKVGKTGGSDGFKAKVHQFMNALVTNFMKNGSKDIEQFRTSK